MNEAIEEAIKTLAKEAKGTIVAGDAMHFSQAALNLANAKATLDNNKRQER